MTETNVEPNLSDEFESCVPCEPEPSNREIARERIKSYRELKAKGSESAQDAPPMGSLRRVFWAASKDSQRGLVEKVRGWKIFELFR